jgi:hypothetical protein
MNLRCVIVIPVRAAAGMTYLSPNSPLLAARDEFEFGRIQLHRRVSRVDVIPCILSILRSGLLRRTGCKESSFAGILTSERGTSNKEVATLLG